MNTVDTSLSTNHELVSGKSSQQVQVQTQDNQTLAELADSTITPGSEVANRKVTPDRQPRKSSNTNTNTDTSNANTSATQAEPFSPVRAPDSQARDRFYPSTPQFDYIYASDPLFSPHSASPFIPNALTTPTSTNKRVRLAQDTILPSASSSTANTKNLQAPIFRSSTTSTSLARIPPKYTHEASKSYFHPNTYDSNYQPSPYYRSEFPVEMSSNNTTSASNSTNNPPPITLGDAPIVTPANSIHKKSYMQQQQQQQQQQQLTSSPSKNMNSDNAGTKTTPSRKTPSRTPISSSRSKAHVIIPSPEEHNGNHHRRTSSFNMFDAPSAYGNVPDSPFGGYGVTPTSSSYKWPPSSPLKPIPASGHYVSSPYSNNLPPPRPRHATEEESPYKRQRLAPPMRGGDREAMSDRPPTPTNASRYSSDGRYGYPVSDSFDEADYPRTKGAPAPPVLKASSYPPPLTPSKGGEGGEYVGYPSPYSPYHHEARHPFEDEYAHAPPPPNDDYYYRESHPPQPYHGRHAAEYYPPPPQHEGEYYARSGSPIPPHHDGGYEYDLPPRHERRLIPPPAMHGESASFIPGDSSASIVSKKSSSSSPGRKKGVKADGSPSRTRPSTAAQAAIAAGMTQPPSASEISFDIHDPPMEPYTQPSEEPVCTVTANITSHDVLCGRGGGTNTQIGNRRFRALVQEFQPTYLLCRRKEKPLLARTIVLIIRNRGGRFLRKDEVSGMLYEVGDEKAEAKTSQALREGLDVRASKTSPGGKKKMNNKKGPQRGGAEVSSHYGALDDELTMAESIPGGREGPPPEAYPYGGAPPPYYYSGGYYDEYGYGYEPQHAPPPGYNYRKRPRGPPPPYYHQPPPPMYNKPYYPPPSGEYYPPPYYHGPPKESHSAMEDFNPPLSRGMPYKESGY